MKTITKLFIYIFLTSSILCSCDDSKEPKKIENQKDTLEVKHIELPGNPEKNIKEIIVDASDYTRFVYFSFEKGMLEISDKQSPKTLSWDMGFHRGDFRTNSGRSTEINANGGVYETDITDITADIKIPEADQFVKDDTLAITLGHTEQMGVLEQKWLPGNRILTTIQKMKKDEKGNSITNDIGLEQYEIIHRGAIIRDFSNMPPRVELSGKVYIVRTATGKFAKIKIVNYQTPNGARPGLPRGARITMQYVYPVQ